EVDLKTGKVLRARNLADTVFGEGAVAVGDVIVSLTWRRGVGLVHDIADFKPIRSFPIEGEGWGLTYDGENLIMSDGTAQLRYLDPETFKVTKTLAVTVEERPVDRLNELEWVEGEIYANVWQTDWIVRIDPQSGAVIGLIDVSRLFPAEKRNEPYNDVPNGVAWDATSGKLYVTGKNWPKMFEIANP
ncbi:MAG: glutaminyl-peptide cyclotransferase, partial [Pseudomonadota bacterium]